MFFLLKDFLRFDLVSLFNGISTFLGYLMPKLIGLVGIVFANGPGDLGLIPVESYQRL